MVLWNLEDIYEFKNTENLIKELIEKVNSFKKLKNALDDNLSKEEFLDILKKYEEISIISIKLILYAKLSHSENTSDPKKISHLNKIEKICTELGNEIIFFTLWFKSLSDKVANKYIEYSGNYNYFFRKIRKAKKYTLLENEEKIINIKDLSGSSAIGKLVEKILGSLTYEFEGKKLSVDQLKRYFFDFDREKRKKAYDSYIKKTKENQSILGDLYISIASDWDNENVGIRKFDTPISVRNLSNSLNDKTVKTFMSVARENSKIFQEYFKLKAKILKIKDMKRYDVLAPYKKDDKEYSFEDSKKIVLDIYKRFDEKMYNAAKKIFDEKHIHSEIQKGKMVGAYCTGALVGQTPYLLLNYSNKLDDVFTLAHEVGHGIHDILAQKQTQLTYDPDPALAEVASIFGEFLLHNKLIEKANKEDKINLLLIRLDDLYNAIARQSFFSIFEVEAHKKISESGDIEDLNDVYLETLKELFGDSLGIDEDFKYEWSGVHHFYLWPFYTYSYAFANLLVLSLIKMHEREGPSFNDKYIRILSYGGSEEVEKILSEVGIDITKKEFWQEGFDLIKEKIEELKELTKQKEKLK